VRATSATTEVALLCSPGRVFLSSVNDVGLLCGEHPQPSGGSKVAAFPVPYLSRCFKNEFQQSMIDWRRLLSSRSTATGLRITKVQVGDSKKVLQTDRISMKRAANAFIGEQVGADIRQWMRLNSHQTHVGAADAAYAYAGLTMPVARSQELDEGSGQNRISRLDRLESKPLDERFNSQLAEPLSVERMAVIE